MSVRTQRLSVELAEPEAGADASVRAAGRDSAGWIASGRQMAARLHRREDPAERVAELEHELERLQALLGAAEAESRAKSRFIAQLSHEIRTPMSGILGMAELLQNTTLSQKQRRFALALSRSGENLLGIVNDILDFAKIEAGKLEIVRTDFSPCDIAAETLELQAPCARQKGVSLHLHVAPGLPGRVSGDAQRLRQVLTNLVSNAVKFTEDGRVELRLGAVAGKPGSCEFSVSDTGVGIDAELLPRLFSPFSQGRSDTVRRAGGTGLGLAISQQLVRLMGGHIDVVSRPGEGSTFRVELPLLPADTTTVPAPEGANVTESGQLTKRIGARILVVEDNAINQEVIGQMLANLGCRVEQRAGAIAGLQALREIPFDLVLMDIRMPGMDGMEALEAFRRHAGPDGFQTQASTPVIAVTADAHGDDRARYLGAGFNGYLSKPFRQKQLQTMLTSHIRLSCPADSSERGDAGAPAASGVTVLDEQSLDRLRELDPTGENKLMERVVNAFETSVARLMPQLQEAMAGLQLAGIRHVAHTLKSSSASIGALELSRICADVEAMARQQQTDGMSGRVAQLQAEVETVRVALKQVLNT
jgi:signal transduction histidine kinase/CheY-like chemotaxis protein/HPt (histidine-containing phosphotransfer) domain-containing protein